jgi:hypothetical protein
LFDQPLLFLIFERSQEHRHDPVHTIIILQTHIHPSFLLPHCASRIPFINMQHFRCPLIVAEHRASTGSVFYLTSSTGWQPALAATSDAVREYNSIHLWDWLATCPNSGYTVIIGSTLNTFEHPSIPRVLSLLSFSDLDNAFMQWCHDGSCLLPRSKISSCHILEVDKTNTDHIQVVFSTWKLRCCFGDRMLGGWWNIQRIPRASTIPTGVAGIATAAEFRPATEMIRVAQENANLRTLVVDTRHELTSLVKISRQCLDMKSTASSSGHTFVPDLEYEFSASKAIANRTVQACAACRAAKIKCDGIKPCKRCITDGRASECIAAESKKGGRKRRYPLGHPLSSAYLKKRYPPMVEQPTRLILTNL